MNIKIFHGLLFFLFMALLASCDEGDIHESTSVYKSGGYVVKMTGDILNVDSWSDGYEVVIAVFDENSSAKYYKTAKQIPGSYDGTMIFHISDVIGDYTQVRLCVVNTLHESVTNIDTIFDINKDKVDGDTIYFETGDADASMWKAVTDLFAKDGCTKCHSTGDKGAGKLSLVSDEAYNALVNVTSNKYSEADRVVPNDASSSVLYNALCANDNVYLGYNHNSLIGDDYSTKALVRDWINNGAKK